jgi:hypothetical protein
MSNVPSGQVAALSSTGHNREEQGFSQFSFSQPWRQLEFRSANDSKLL